MYSSRILPQPRRSLMEEAKKNCSYLHLLSLLSHQGCHLCHHGLGPHCSQDALGYLPSNQRRPPWAGEAGLQASQSWYPGHDLTGLVTVEQLVATTS